MNLFPLWQFPFQLRIGVIIVFYQAVVFVLLIG